MTKQLGAVKKGKGGGMSSTFTESIVEAATLEWFASLGYATAHGPNLAPDEPTAERDSFEQVVAQFIAPAMGTGTTSPGAPKKGAINPINRAPTLGAVV